MIKVVPSLKSLRARLAEASLLRSILLGLALISLAGMQSPAATKAPGDPPVIDEQPIGRNVTVGGHVALSVLAHGDSALTYQWRKGPVNLVNDARISGATNAVLNIDPVLFSEGSNYTVVVTAGGVSTTSAPVSVVVNDILIVPSPQTVGANISVFGQIGDVYRVERRVNFGLWTTNSYATNYTGRALTYDDGTGGPGLRQFRGAVERMLPVIYTSNAAPRTLRAYGKLNQVWRFESSSDFQQWSPILTVTNTTGWVHFNDPQLTPPPIRFYRISPP
jgi:hypothetical protein